MIYHELYWGPQLGGRILTGGAWPGPLTHCPPWLQTDVLKTILAAIQEAMWRMRRIAWCHSLFILALLVQCCVWQYFNKEIDNDDDDDDDDANCKLMQYLQQCQQTKTLSIDKYGWKSKKSAMAGIVENWMVNLALRSRPCLLSVMWHVGLHRVICVNVEDWCSQSPRLSSAAAAAWTTRSM